MEQTDRAGKEAGEDIPPEGEASSAHATAERPRGSPAAARPPKSTFREYAEAITVALLIALFLRSFFVEAFKIPSGSMIPTLQIGDHIFVNKLSYRTEVPYSILGIHVPFGGTTLHDWGLPERGDIMVFRYPVDPDVDYIKRVIGLPGDTIELKSNQLRVNGVDVPRDHLEPYRYVDQRCQEDGGQSYRENHGGKSYTTLLRDGAGYLGRDYGPTVVEPGHVFAMGDNRDNSSDSRVWGQVPVGNIKGRAMVIWLSLDACGGVRHPLRLGRMFHRLH